MALLKSKNVPEDAIELKEEEAMAYVWDLVNDWDSFADKWALQWSPFALGALNSICGMLINQHYRRKLKLRNYGQLAALIPISLVPGTFTGFYHRVLVSTDLLLMKGDCPVCYELKSAFVQTSLGIAYPMVLGPWAALMLANRYGTARIPSLVTEKKELLKFTWKMTKPFMGTLAYMATIQVAASSIFTFFEMKNNLAIRKKLLEIEQRLESEFSLDRQFS